MLLSMCDIKVVTSADLSKFKLPVKCSCGIFHVMNVAMYVLHVMNVAMYV